ncbi:MAG: SDR family NAD(P)-dependent oxidoreductase, partial [Thermoplasmataceae archaeon]
MVDEIDEIVKFSRLLGSDKNLVLHGGGNTSVKFKERDHTGKEIDVLRVKGSGSDLASIERTGFTGLRMNDILAARNISTMNDFDMMAYLKKSSVDPSEPSPSVESFLHGFINRKYVMHSHSDSILSLTNTELTDDEIKKILPDVIVIPYIPPGFTLAKAILEKVESMGDNVKGLVLSRHGLFTFSNIAEEAYNNHLNLVKKADEYVSGILKGDLFNQKYKENDEFEKFLPFIRGAVSKNQKKIMIIDRSDEGRNISRSIEAEQMEKSGPATPDMLIRTKYNYLYLEDTNKIKEKIEEFAEEYRKDYEKYVSGYPMHDPYPAAIIAQGYGIITIGKNLVEAGIILDQIKHTLYVNSKASKISNHKFISKKEAFEMEYWPLEEAKLKKGVKKPLEGTVSIVTGAANGIGLETFRKLSINGSLVVAMDLDENLQTVCDNVKKETKVSNLPIHIDLSKDDQISDAFSKIIKNFGGVDIVFNNAGILKSEPLDVISIETLDLHYKINGRAPFLVSREAFKIMKEQGIGGNLIFNITKNLTHPGPGMASYGTSKAFAAQACHYFAKEGGKFGIRANIINPDKIFNGSKIWENGVLESRAKAKGQTVEEYKTQNLLKKE